MGDFVLKMVFYANVDGNQFISEDTMPDDNRIENF